MRWLALVLVVSMLLPAAGCIRDFDERERDNRVRLRSIDVAAPRVTTGSVELAINSTLDNRGADSDPIQVKVKAFDERTGFLEATKIAPNRTIEEDKTVSIQVTMDLPRRSGYRIEVEVYEAGQIVETGRVVVRNVTSLEPTVHETSVAITTMEFLVRNVSSSRVLIETEVYLTNEGTRDSTPLRMQVKARDADTGLLADQVWTEVGSIPPDETRIRSVDLDVPDEHNYVVDVLLWDGNLSVEQGQGTVQLLPTMTKKADEEIQVTDPEIEDFLGEDRDEDHARGDRAPSGEGAAAETPALGPALALALLAGLAVAIRRRGSR